MPKTHPTYDEEFRRNAVELLLQSNRPLKRVAHELGVAANSLLNWRDRFLGKGGATKVAQTQSEDRSGAPLALADPAAEIRRLRRENEYLRRQREILKKAVSILSEDPQSGMR